MRSEHSVVKCSNFGSRGLGTARLMLDTLEVVVLTYTTVEFSTSGSNSKTDRKSSEASNGRPKGDKKPNPNPESPAQ